MTNVQTPEPRVTKRKTPKDQIPEEPGYVRVEFQAPPEWLDQVDAAAKDLGMSRSAYIRMATTRQMQSDKRADASGTT